MELPVRHRMYAIANELREIHDKACFFVDKFADTL